MQSCIFFFVSWEHALKIYFNERDVVLKVLDLDLVVRLDLLE